MTDATYKAGHHHVPVLSLSKDEVLTSRCHALGLKDNPIIFLKFIMKKFQHYHLVMVSTDETISSRENIFSLNDDVFNADKIIFLKIKWANESIMFFTICCYIAASYCRKLCAKI